MNFSTDDYSVDTTDALKAVVTGILRLPTPTSYEEPFTGVKEGIVKATGPYVVDLSGVSFLNSSGITALARLVIFSRDEEKKIVFRGDDSVPWQQKSLGSLKRLWDEVEIDLV